VYNSVKGYRGGFSLRKGSELRPRPWVKNFQIKIIQRRPHPVFIPLIGNLPRHSIATKNRFLFILDILQEGAQWKKGEAQRERHNR